jgi:hypothetical protein
MSKALTQFALRNKTSLPWLLLALACMLASAYCFFGWMSAVGRISGWIGLPRYVAQIPRLESQARLWSTLAIALPFVAALLLSFGKRASDQRPRADAPTSLTYRAESPADKRLGPMLRYLGHLAASVLGTLGFVVVLFLVGLLLHKLGVRAG